MMAPLPTPSHAEERPELPRVRLDVRAASGRTIGYEVGAADFLIGGSPGCDLRLPAANLPPIICQISRKSDGIRVRRVTPLLPVLLNGSPLAANATTPVASGDVLTVAELEIAVVVPEQPYHLVPRFVPIEAEAPAAQPAPRDGDGDIAPSRNGADSLRLWNRSGRKNGGVATRNSFAARGNWTARQRNSSPIVCCGINDGKRSSRNSNGNGPPPGWRGSIRPISTPGTAS